MKALRILVVEDDAIVGLLLTEVLEEMGHVVCAVATREADAVAAAALHHPDLMIVDATLRDGSGITAVEQITRITPIPHIFVSGDVLMVVARRPTAVVVQKPYHEADITRAIRRVIDDPAPPPDKRPGANE